jgi:NADH-quinone oxidoreductase subunit N
MVWISAALSMTIGNLGALLQDNVKRLLAYSSIAHAGYLLAAFAANPGLAASPAMFYSASYAAMNVGAFVIVSHFANAEEKYVTLEDYAGLGRKSPMLAATFTFFLMSLIGIPITGGFFAKFYVLNSILKSGLIGLSIILVMNSAIGAYYYLRIIVMMYMREPRRTVPVTPTPASALLALAICVVATLYLGVFPNRVLDFTSRSAQQIVEPASSSMVSSIGH